MKNLFILYLISILAFSCGNPSQKEVEKTFDDKVSEYLKKFPYQDSWDYSRIYTGGDPANFNRISGLSSPVLLKAGEDIVVRSNNDTYYTGGFLYLSDGPVKLSASFEDTTRFYSFQLMDNRNVNFHNIIQPSGNYYLYFGEKPIDLEGTLIESPSLMVGVIIRVEVKDLNNLADMELAQKVYNGIDISGPVISEYPEGGFLDSLDESVAQRANELMDSVIAHTPFRELVAAPGMIPDQISYLEHSAATKGAWGAPVAEHSTYQLIFHDTEGNPLEGRKGPYILTTEEPEVDAFWSVTVYDTERGGYFHPNADNRYHINNTTAVRNQNGTITFTFKTKCEEGDLNCLEVPEGQFDITARFYLPGEALISGKWNMPSPELNSK